MPTTQRQKIEGELKRHGCVMLDVRAGDWHKWSVGDLPARHFIFVGPAGGFREGTSKTNSRDRPDLKAKLLAEAAEIRI